MVFDTTLTRVSHLAFLLLSSSLLLCCSVFVDTLPKQGHNISTDLFVGRVMPMMQKEILELRRGFEQQRRQIEYLGSETCTLAMLRAAMALRQDEIRAEWKRAIEEVRLVVPSPSLRMYVVCKLSHVCTTVANGVCRRHREQGGTR